MMKCNAERVGKRRLSIECLHDGDGAKRRRKSDTSDSQRLLTAEAGRRSSAYGSSGFRTDPAETNIRDYPHHRNNETGETSSNTGEAPSTDEEEETSSAQSGKTSSADRGESSEGEELIQNLPLQKKPPISALSHTSPLHARLSSFLPELQKANTELELESPAKSLSRRLDDVGDDEEHYIEMSLGLGVFKEKRSSEAPTNGVTMAHDYGTGSSEETGSDYTEAQDEMPQQEVESTPLMDLMGSKQLMKKKRPGIHEVSDG